MSPPLALVGSHLHHTCPALRSFYKVHRILTLCMDDADGSLAVSAIEMYGDGGRVVKRRNGQFDIPARTRSIVCWTQDYRYAAYKVERRVGLIAKGSESSGLMHSRCFDPSGQIDVQEMNAILTHDLVLYGLRWCHRVYCAFRYLQL